jgi:hypothetical protein
MVTKGAAVIHANGAFTIAVATGLALISLRIAHGIHHVFSVRLWFSARTHRTSLMA